MCWGGWPVGSTSSEYLDPTVAERPYRHWHLALELVTHDKDEIRRGTAIQKLWNAVDSRIRQLHDTYRLSELKRILKLPRNTDMLEMLGRLELVRPFVLQRLKEIRNRIEHQDRGTPSHDECLTLIDIVWYFLRSTDAFAVNKVTSFERVSYCDSIARSPFVSVEYSDSWLPSVFGFLPESDVQTRPRANALLIELVEPITTDEHELARVRGTVALGSDQLTYLAREYFLINLPDTAPFH